MEVDPGHIVVERVEKNRRGGAIAYVDAVDIHFYNVVPNRWASDGSIQPDAVAASDNVIVRDVGRTISFRVDAVIAAVFYGTAGNRGKRCGKINPDHVVRKYCISDSGMGGAAPYTPRGVLDHGMVNEAQIEAGIIEIDPAPYPPAGTRRRCGEGDRAVGRTVGLESPIDMEPGVVGKPEHRPGLQLENVSERYRHVARDLD